jgi:hypothetical protein
MLDIIKIVLKAIRIFCDKWSKVYYGMKLILEDDDIH